MGAHLASKEMPFGPYDVLFAGQAMSRELTLITHNTSEFERVPGLKGRGLEGLGGPTAAQNNP
jgi:tRNA(fMet)-specific endonuclease VapC